MSYYCHYNSPLGDILITASQSAVQGLHFVGEKHYPGIEPDAVEQANHPVLSAAVRQLAEYFEGHRTGFDLALDPMGTSFQQQVWSALRTIPYGETRSYAQLARQLGDGKAVRAVGAANGRNPISIVVPCHRVIGADGSLTGYAGGLERKQALLRLESRQRSMLIQHL